MGDFCRLEELSEYPILQFRWELIEFGHIFQCITPFVYNVLTLFKRLVEPLQFYKDKRNSLTNYLSCRFFSESVVGYKSPSPPFGTPVKAIHSQDTYQIYRRDIIISVPFCVFDVVHFRTVGYTPFEEIFLIVLLHLYDERSTILIFTSEIEFDGFVLRCNAFDLRGGV